MAQRLNKIERLKAEVSPWQYRRRLHTLDLSDLTEADRFYLKNYGIYNIKLRPEAFMIRLRIAGGRVSLSQLRGILELAKRHDLELLLTARAQIELHRLDISNVLEVYDSLSEYGLTSAQTLTDNVRNIVTDPWDGLLEEGFCEAYPLIEAMQGRILERPEWMGMLPRKVNTAITANPLCEEHFFGNDILFAPALKGERIGFNLFLGGKNAQVARPADIFAEPGEVADLFEAVLQTYMHHGLRASRSKTRLFHLLEEIGIERFRTLMARYSPHTLEPAGTTQLRRAPVAPFRKLADGSYGVQVQSRFGRISLRMLEEVVAFAAHEGARIRLSVNRNLYLIGLSTPQTPFAHIPGASHLLACAGRRDCALSLWDVKGEAHYLPLERIGRLGVRVGFSGCLKGCGHHHHTDIGLVGLRTNLFGPTDKAARLFVGAEWQRAGVPGRLLFYVVPLKHLHRLVSEILDAFEESGFSDFESFSHERLNRFSVGFLRVWLLARLSLGRAIALKAQEEEEQLRRWRAMDGFPDGEDYDALTRRMMHDLWDEKEKR